MNKLEDLKIICPNCNGKGYIPKQGFNQYPDCLICKGSGLVKAPDKLNQENKELRETRRIFREGLR